MGSQLLYEDEPVPSAHVEGSMRIPLLALTAVFLNGCLYTAVKSPTYLSAAVGDAGSQSPLRVGTATRADVISRFGKPTYSTEHELAIGYLWGVKVGQARGVLLGPCSNPYVGSTDVTTEDGIWLEFDDHGVLKRYVKSKWLKDKEQESWLLFCVPVPDKPRTDQIWFDEERN